MENLDKAKQLLADAEVVIVTAGNGMAQVEGLDILAQGTFDQDFPVIAQKYDVHTIGDALDKRFASWQEQWLFWSKLVQKYTLAYQPSKAMRQLKQLIGQKEYFIATSTFGHFFETAGFNENRIFNAFGDWTKMQCSSGINHGLKDNRAIVAKLATKEIDQVTAAMVPKCKICQQPMELHMPLNAHFYPDTAANTRFRWFLTGNEDKRVVFLELGVDATSPQLLDPIVHLVQQFPQWSYVAADLTPELLPDDLQKRSAATGSGSAALIAGLVQK
ncbi:Sir2 family NAD-dependent protein deacetylase [Lactobacillus sp. ESL0677]|uniref:Sir2 family NAD-dependent protein deacetylase n=1 Tax=Lactobacillus sp. ESL0677 TaxID=2983208 RepID=UPI0023F83D88|nr:Sir2 family NAD-dependent protein deacetylase [Lactobacillus sp. ESL0677]WEV36853.1 Sir2 family NAD-dependent protein deacetylase [Lactobacillus sp. ESL0677]